MIMKKSVITLIIAGSSLAASSAFAGGSDVITNNNTTAINSVYVAGDMGYATVNTPDKYLPSVPGTTSNSRSIGYFTGGANAGYQRLVMPNVLVGAEFGYNYNGQSQYKQSSQYPYKGSTYYNNTKLTVTSQDLHLLATGTYLFNNGFNVFAKGGVARVHQDTKYSATDYSSKDTSIGYKPMVAGGVGYQFKLVNVYAQYGHIFGEDSDNFNDYATTNGKVKIASVDSVTLGVAVRVNI